MRRYHDLRMKINTHRPVYDETTIRDVHLQLERIFDICFLIDRITDGYSQAQIGDDSGYLVDVLHVSRTAELCRRTDDGCS
jgi:hypothetical protein